MATQPASSATPPPPPPPPLQPPKGRRNKFFWPLLIAVNFSIGAYLYTRTKNKGEKTEGDEPATAVSSALTTTDISTAASVGHTSTSPPVTISELVKPIPMDEQRELLKWILEEKRKVNTKDPQEKKQIDEEKVLLKQLIRAKSIPSL